MTADVQKGLQIHEALQSVIRPRRGKETSGGRGCVAKALRLLAGDAVGAPCFFKRGPRKGSGLCPAKEQTQERPRFAACLSDTKDNKMLCSMVLEKKIHIMKSCKNLLKTAEYNLL